MAKKKGTGLSPYLMVLGTFSVLTPGVFPALIMDIPVNDIMDGTQAMFTYIKGKTGMDNMALLLQPYTAWTNKVSPFVIMPYCERPDLPTG
jgi:hypothetical protein